MPKIYGEESTVALAKILVDSTQNKFKLNLTFKTNLLNWHKMKNKDS